LYLIYTDPVYVQPAELRVLTSFLVLADELNFTRAARRLNMTQPPLSLQIKQLEAQIGAQLFERTNAACG
jgi:DNA-binding transcriptional LysR family regulator